MDSQPKCEYGNEGCDPESQHPCWTHKIKHMQANGMNTKIPRYWKGPSGAELARQEVAAAKANGVDIQYAGPGSRWV